MKTKSAIYPVIFAVLLLSILFCCKKEAIKTAPTVTVANVTNITATTATSGGEITSDGGASVTSRGVCWSTSQNPTTSDSKTTNGSGTGSFSSSIAGLTPGATYNIKSYATNSVGTGYSSQSTFTTLALAPVLTTTDLSAVTSTTASSGGNITNDGGSAVTARGVCWSTSQNPTIADSKISSGTGSGSFTSVITGLTPGATYYVRAYATNSIGTGYGNQVTTTTTAVLPVLTTTAVSALTSSTAASGGNITSDGGVPVTSRGVCWGTSANPTTASSKTTDGTGSGSFTSSIAGLMPVTTYYVRAYATNNIGTAYGNQMTTTTTAALPTLSTLSVTSILNTSATSGGNITSNGGSLVTARGVCWSTSQNPTTANSKTTDGTGVGSFASNITGLISNTTYYVRAYATNSVETGYGSEVSFKTSVSNSGTVTDIDGNVYHTVTIGTQVWMVENLKTTKYNDGTSITFDSGNSDWLGLEGHLTGAYCNYNNDANNSITYGRLYNKWAIINGQNNPTNIAPIGWHVSTDDEWLTLIDFLGKNSAGEKLKETGITHWQQSTNALATNESGFTALPGGWRDQIGSYGKGYQGNWWTSSLSGYYNSICFEITYERTALGGSIYRSEVKASARGFSVRCVKD